MSLCTSPFPLMLAGKQERIEQEKKEGGVGLGQLG